MTVKRAEMQNDLAMTVVLVSAAMLFVTLFMGYGIYRSSAAIWPPTGFNPISLLLPTLSTVLIAISSWFSHQTTVATREGHFARAHGHLNITLALGTGFMVSQALLWANLKANGLLVASGIYTSILYSFTWIHAFHVALGLASLIYLKIVLSDKTRLVLQKAINVEKFWHFLGIIWGVMFLILFVL